MDYTTLLTIVGASIVSSVGAFMWYMRKNDTYWEKRRVPYAPRQNLITGFKIFFSKAFHETLNEHYKKYGRIFGAFEFRTPFLTVCEPDLLRDILVKDFHAFNYRRESYIGDPMFDKMISVLKDEDWKRVRILMSSAFTSKKMRQMTHIINECSQTAVETFGKFHSRKDPIDVKSIFGAFAMDVIASSAFATKIDSHNDPENIFVKEAKQSFIQPSSLRLLMLLLVPKCISVKLQLGAAKSMDFFKNVILQVIEERKGSGEKYNDFLQLLMDSEEELETKKLKSKTQNESQDDESDKFGSVLSNELSTAKKYKKLSEDELVAQCVLFFIVGYETTASTLGFMAYELALNPDCQEKLIKEVDEAFAKNKMFDYDIIRKMKYLDCVAAETLRMYPPLFRSERTACENYKLGNTGFVVEKGTAVAFDIYSLHHDPEFFQNPEQFDPDRFLPENLNHPQFAYLPFGAGPRNCLGMRFALMEIKICICNILRNYRLKKAETTKIPLDFKKGFIFISVENLPLIAEKRNDSR